MPDDTAPLRARLHYLQLGSPEPEGLARFYAEVLDMRIEQRGGSWICRNQDRCLVFSPGRLNALLGAGYAIADEAVLPALRARIAASLAEVTSVDAELLQPGAIAFRDPDDNRMVFGVPLLSYCAQGLEAPQVRLQHVVVGSLNIERMVRFYTTVVGLRESDEVRDAEGGLRTCFMRSDDEHHSFAVFRTPEKRLDHHCFELPDWNAIRDWGDRLAARRIPIKWGPGRHGPGNNLFIFFQDPEGNWVELSTELEVIRDERPVGIWQHEERTLNSWGHGLLRS
jgi:catechol 2,3-dioxygenase